MVDFQQNVSSKMNLSIARYNFFSRKQSTDETLDTFITALTRLSWSCGLGELRDSLVKDIMICNLALNSYHLRDRLLENDPTSLQDVFNFLKTDCATVDSKQADENHVLKTDRKTKNSEQAIEDSFLQTACGTVDSKQFNENRVQERNGKKILNEEAKEKCVRKGRNVKRERMRKIRCVDCGGPHEKSSCPIFAEGCSATLEPASYLTMEVKVEGDDGEELDAKPTKLPIKKEYNEIKLEEASELTNAKKRTIKCRYCEMEFSSQNDLKTHKKSHSNKPYSCKNCCKSFRYKHHLTRHFRIHTGERPHMCSECGKRFIQESALYVHLRTHSGEKPYICNYCTKSFRQKLYLVVHMRTHTKEKPHQCHYCGKCFSQKSALNVHVRCHTGETPYHCSECGKAFAYKVDFNTHLITHTGQTPHRCRDCGKSFSTKAVLKKHSRKHTGERPFSCTMCNKAFSFKHHLVRHMRLHEEGDGAKLCIV